jgi:hypothetical protein
MGQDLYKPLNDALLAAARGPFFPDWEFELLFGLTRAEVASAAGSISAPSASTPMQQAALAGAVTNLLGYPHGHQAEWSAWLSVSPAELELAHAAWRAAVLRPN